MEQLVGQMALIQDLSQRQEELRVLVRQLLPNNQLGQTSEVEEQVTAQPPSTQEDNGEGSFACFRVTSPSTTSPASTG